MILPLTLSEKKRKDSKVKAWQCTEEAEEWEPPFSEQRVYVAPKENSGAVCTDVDLIDILAEMMNHVCPL